MTVLFTVNGFMGVWEAGPQADVGRHLSKNPVDHGLGLADWVPIGYPSGDFPLSVGVDAGLAELRNQRAQHPGPYMVSAWSEGAIIAKLFIKENLADFKGAALFGDPYRAPGQWAPHQGGAPYGYPIADPGGAGIGGPRNNWAGPDSIHSYAHYGDIYTVCPVDDQSGDDQRIIFDFVPTQWSGLMFDLIDFAYTYLSRPAESTTSLIKAVVSAINFYGGRQVPHQNYDPRPGMNYLTTVARGP